MVNILLQRMVQSVKRCIVDLLGLKEQWDFELLEDESHEGVVTILACTPERL